MFRQVIVGVDAGPASRDAIAVARLLAAADAHMALAHVNVLTPVRGASGMYGPTEDARSMELLERVRDESGVQAEVLAVTASSAGRGLHHLAETRGADLLSVGSNARSFIGRVLVGDATRASLVGAPCAVAIAPLGYAQRDGAAVARIGVGYDGSPESEAALACAREVAEHHGAALAAMTVLTPAVHAGVGRGARGGADEAELAGATADLAALEGVEGTVAVGLAGEELAIFGGTVDLLVIGSRGYGPVRRLMLGGTSVHLAANARCPLVVLPRP
jgi:nucleotide-binding universal stress UspA family protein